MIEEDVPIGERARFAELAGIFVRHGLGGLAARLGLALGSPDQTGEKDAPGRVVAMLRELGPVAVKLGQVLATREDLLTPEWVAALATLQDQVTPLPFEQIEADLAASLGAPVDQVFARFDRTPIAAASIAQVHSAALQDGTEVVVKIRRPGIATRVDADLRLLRRVARLAEKQSPEVRRLKPDELLRSFAEGLSQEMDLSAEAAACESIGAYLTTLGVYTPRFFWDHVGRRVNVQERLVGQSVRAITAVPIDRSTAKAIAGTYADAVLRMIIFNGRFHADPHPGNVFVQPDGTIAFIDFGAVGTLTPARRSELVSLVLSIAGDDARGVGDVLMRWSGDYTVDARSLHRDLEELIGEFRGAVLEQIQLSVIFQRVFALLRDYRLALPPDLALLLRTLLTAEGFVRSLDPEFDIAARAMPIARELMRERLSPADLKKGGRRLVASLGRLAAASPELVALAESVARSGALPVEVRTTARPSSNITGRVGDPNVLTVGFLVAGALLADSHTVPATILFAAAIANFVLSWWVRKGEGPRGP
ncbi:ubiquinone biosynthesis protein [Sphingomonas sp. CL5.1]|uniref:ABC1 kinase family protein n=1 Tax=Sphingomonas sp. CL5.1 TaxID=2653203 RepID=UPI001583466C|nr:AarF/UbiB family protein [Sphingomonas sp. CL5.1]QKR99288.1 ubiquinone biosynthesis protein [Sphingomonas sp. CL5.1]